MKCNKCGEELLEGKFLCTDCDYQEFNNVDEQVEVFEQMLKLVDKNVDYYKKAFLKANKGKKSFNLSALLFGPAFIGYRKFKSYFFYKYCTEIACFSLFFLLMARNGYSIFIIFYIAYTIVLWVKFAMEANNVYFESLAIYVNELRDLGSTNFAEKDRCGTSIYRSIEFVVYTILFHAITLPLGLYLFGICEY